ncbi:hypothetical protein KM043_009660 [Ampulex compressa]|nr:hypothetical protein KM043_009660 [Ampulex compressa]
MCAIGGCLEEGNWDRNGLGRIGAPGRLVHARAPPESVKSVRGNAEKPQVQRGGACSASAGVNHTSASSAREEQDARQSGYWSVIGDPVHLLGPVSLPHPVPRRSTDTHVPRSPPAPRMVSINAPA